MNKKVGALFFLALMLSTSLVLAGTVKITVRMGEDYDALIRVKDGDTILDTPQIKNYPMGLAELTYETGRSQADYLILVHQSGNVVDSYTLNDIDTGSELKVDFRNGVPPEITDLKEEQQTEEEVSSEETTENVTEEPEPENVTTEVSDPSFDFSKGLSTGKAVFYSSEEGFTLFSWILLGVVVLIIIAMVFNILKDKNKEEVDKYKDELESIKKKIKKKIREIKVLKARGMKLKKMIELEQGFLEEKKDLKNVEKEVDEEDEKGKD